MSTARHITPNSRAFLAPPRESTHAGLDLAQRNGLRFLAGLGHARRRVSDFLDEDGEEIIEWVPARLFPPEPSIVAELLRRELVEADPARAGEYRPTEDGIELLPVIGPRG